MKEFTYFFRAAKPLETRKSNKKETNTVSRRLLPAVDFLIFLLREKTRVHLKRGSLRWFVPSAPGCP
jgi:hypothetical protein